MSRRSKEQARIARRDAYLAQRGIKKAAGKTRLDFDIARAVSLVAAWRVKQGKRDTAVPSDKEIKAARSAVIVTSDSLLSHLTQEQRDHVAGVIIDVEMTETPDDSPEHYVLQNNRCFANARDLTRHDTSRRISYVEGVADFGDYQVYHAWNEIDGVRFDVTAVINQKVYDESDWTKTVYRGDTVTREQLAERASRRDAGAKRFTAWVAEHKDAAKKLSQQFYARYGKELDEEGFTSDQEVAIWDVIWAQFEGYPDNEDINDSYFSRVEKMTRFGFDDDWYDWATVWASDKIAEMKDEMNEVTVKAATVTAMSAAV